jgi:hypothetical protein
MYRRIGILGLGLVVIVGLLGTDCHALTLTVDAKANIFGAGHATAPAPGGGGGGILPPFVAFTVGIDQVLTFSQITGDVSCCSGGTTFNGPDGNGFATGNTDILSFGGISGIVHEGSSMFLVGVFLDDQEPTGSAPPSLDFSDTKTTDVFTQLAPLLNQVFFIGNGLTDTGNVQRFIVPDTATRLFLGFADALEFGNPTSEPGYYDDNVGTLSATFALTGPTPVPPVPEPTTWVLLSSGLACLMLKRWLQRKA